MKVVPVLLLAVSGCAQDQTSSANRPSHYAVRTNRLGSNIPQPYAAGADSGSDRETERTVSTMNQLGNTSSSMGGSGGR